MILVQLRELSVRIAFVFLSLVDGTSRQAGPSGTIERLG